MTPARSPKPARELAARALCQFHGVPEDTLFEGKPMWMSYLYEVETVLKAVGWKDEKLPLEGIRDD